MIPAVQGFFFTAEPQRRREFEIFQDLLLSLRRCGSAVKKANPVAVYILY